MSVLIILGIVGIIYKIFTDFSGSDTNFEVHLPQQFKGKAIDYTQMIEIPKGYTVKHFAASGSHFFLYFTNDKQQEEIWVVEHLTGKVLRRFGFTAD